MKKTILVVDDSEATRDIIKEKLEDAGYEVITASNGQEALNILEKNLVDLIVSDIHMPVMGGTEMLRRIQIFKLNIPVLLMTSLYYQGIAELAKERGALDCIEKGQPSLIISKIKEALAN